MPRAFQAADATLLAAKESEQGTAATPDRLLGKIDASVELPDPVRNIDRESYVGTNSLTTDELVQRTFDFEDGTIPIKPVDAFPFELLLGRDKNASDEVLLADDPSEQNSATLQLQYERPSDPDLVNNYIGVVPSGGSITVAEDEDLICEIDVDGLDVQTDVTKQSDTSSVLSKDPFSFSDVTSSLTMFGVTFSRVNDFEVEIDKNTEIKKYVNDDNPEKPDEIILQQPDVSISAEISVSSDDIYDEILTGTSEFSVDLGFTRPNGDTLTITAPNCLIESADHDIPEEGTVDVPVEIQAETVKITTTA